MACNSGTVATVTLTATAISTDQNACLSVSMVDVPVCAEFSTCLGSIGTGQLGTLACTIGPQITTAGAYAGYSNMAFDRVVGDNGCCGGAYMRHYSAANTAFSSTNGRIGFFGKHCAFNIPPAIESYSCSTMLAAINCCCSTQKGLAAIYIPNEWECGQESYIVAKMCCFQRFGGTLTDDCYYQLVTAGTCCTCHALSCACAQAGTTPYGMWMRMVNHGAASDKAIDWWSNAKPIWGFCGQGNGNLVCAACVNFLNQYHTAGCAPWAVGSNMDGPCGQCSMQQCTMNMYPSGNLCIFFSGCAAMCANKPGWGIPCASLHGFYPLIMTGCNLQVYQHANAGTGVQFKTTFGNPAISPLCCSTGWWCAYGFCTNCSIYDNCCCLGLKITPGGPSGCIPLSPDRPHNFVRWITYNHLDKQNYFLWYHECTPVMNGIYSVSEAQMYCIYIHMSSCNIEACNAGSWQCSDSTINTKFATKKSCVPAIWCAYGKAWCMLNTTAFASGACEFSMFASPTDWLSSPLVFCRFVSKDLVNWLPQSSTGCIFQQEICNTPTTSCFIDFNPTTCNFETNCSNFTALPASNTAILEHFTSTGKLERSGIVMNPNDRFYVRNSSNTVSASVTVWGYNE
jgi:hypothetical protein